MALYAPSSVSVARGIGWLVAVASMCWHFSISMCRSARLACLCCVSQHVMTVNKFRCWTQQCCKSETSTYINIEAYSFCFVLFYFCFIFVFCFNFKTKYLAACPSSFQQVETTWKHEVSSLLLAVCKCFLLFPRPNGCSVCTPVPESPEVSLGHLEALGAEKKCGILAHSWNIPIWFTQLRLNNESFQRLFLYLTFS